MITEIQGNLISGLLGIVEIGVVLFLAIGMEFLTKKPFSQKQKEQSLEFAFSNDTKL